MSTPIQQVKTWLGSNCGIARLRYRIMSLLSNTYIKQCLFSRTTRLVVLAALILSLIVTYATDIWKVEVEFDLPGKLKVDLSDRITHTTIATDNFQKGDTQKDKAIETDYDWDEDKLRKEAGNDTDAPDSYKFLDSIIGKFFPPVRVTKVNADTRKKDPAKPAPKPEESNTQVERDLLSSQTNKTDTLIAKPTKQNSNLQKIVPVLPTFMSENINCAKLIDEDITEMKKAKQFQSTSPKVIIPDYHYIIATKKCAKFIQERHYITEPLSAEEAEFPLAFSMLLFKDIEQFERLLRAIYRPQNYYCIHVDNKSNSDVKRAAQGIANCFENVFLSSKSYDVEWGAFSVLEPELQCMEDLWNKTSWKYFINLTGQEFPLQTIWDMVKILKVYNGANNMEGTIKRRNKDRTVYVHNGYYGTDVKLDPCPINATITKGSVHITASRAYVDFVLHDERALKFRDWVKDTGVPDETFFTSLNFSPQLGVPGAYKGEPETDTKKNLFITRYKNWGTYPFEYECYGQRVRMVCVHGVGDLSNLASRKELFTNKFYIDYHPLALDCLEEHVLNRTRNEVLGKTNFDVSFYKELDFVKNHV